MWPSAVGFDEHSLKHYKKGHIGFVTMVIDHTTKSLIELVDGQDSAALHAALDSVAGKERVKIVTMDMDESFRKFVRDSFPNAHIIADHFHVSRLLIKALNRVRIDITGDQRKNPVRSLLIRNSEDLEAHEHSALWRWLSAHPSAKELYLYKETLRRVYKSRSYKLARKRLSSLLDEMGQSHLAAVKRIRDTLLSWFREILSYFRFNRLTNARVEGFNTKAKLLQRRGFGYKSFSNYRLRLLNDCA